MKEQLKEVRHDYIRYANCWEDADILMDALAIKSGDRVLSIGSAGDNSFSMLAYDPEFVLAVDINPVQLNLIVLKKAAIASLDHESFLQFLGFHDCPNRWDLFLIVKQMLPPELAAFWSGRKKEIEDGIIYQGKFERYFKSFRKNILPLIHTEKRISELFNEKNSVQQEQFFHAEWNNRRWRILFKLFFSKFVMGRLGRDPEFLKEVKVPVSTFILDQSKKHLSSVNCQQNYFLQFMLTGQFKTTLPNYARKESFEVIKKKLDRIMIYNGFAEAAFNEYQGFNKFNLSNIFEYMNPAVFRSVSKNLVQNGQPGSRYAYWNLMVPRQMSEINPELVPDREKADTFTQKDNGFFYSKFIIDVKS
ncbi:MAG: BtaA family protein [Cyclobacteriaceae bacterium]|nr:BtaA family protein [Cyclobacteriaceae bacterium]